MLRVCRWFFIFITVAVAAQDNTIGRRDTLSLALLDSYLFYLNAGIENRPHVVIVIQELPEVLGRSRWMNNKTEIELALDPYFYNSFYGTSQMTRLVYHLMGLIMEMETRKGFMRQGWDYQQLTMRRMLRTFKRERKIIRRRASQNNNIDTNHGLMRVRPD